MEQNKGGLWSDLKEKRVKGLLTGPRSRLFGLFTCALSDLIGKQSASFSRNRVDSFLSRSSLNVIGAASPLSPPKRIPRARIHQNNDWAWPGAVHITNLAPWWGRSGASVSWAKAQVVETMTIFRDEITVDDICGVGRTAGQP